MIIRTLRALMGINSSALHPIGLPHPCPWPRTPFQPLGLSAPAPVTPQQGQSPALCSTTLRSHEHRPSQTHEPMSQSQFVSKPILGEMPDAQGWGCPQCSGCPAPGRGGGMHPALLVCMQIPCGPQLTSPQGANSCILTVTVS